MQNMPKQYVQFGKLFYIYAILITFCAWVKLWSKPSISPYTGPISSPIVRQDSGILRRDSSIWVYLGVDSSHITSRYLSNASWGVQYWSSVHSWYSPNSQPVLSIPSPQSPSTLAAWWIALGTPQYSWYHIQLTTYLPDWWIWDDQFGNRFTSVPHYLSICLVKIIHFVAMWPLVGKRYAGNN